MIKIHLSKEQILNAQKKHWAWFDSNCLKKLIDLEKEKNIDKTLKGFISVLLKDKTRLKNLICGTPSEIRNEIQYVRTHFDDLIFSEKLESEELTKLAEIKKIVPSHKWVRENQWESKYKEVFKLVQQSKLFDSMDLKACGEPEEFIDFIRLINTKLKNANVKGRLEYVFSYEKLKEKGNSWGAYDWVKILNLKTCPYCNRQFIHYYSKGDGTKEMRPALDHFYPKSIYPFLGVSLFNLVPSCHVCNSSFKGEKDFYLEQHVNPFEERFGESGKFVTNIKSESIGDDFKYDISYLTSVKDNADFDLTLYVESDNIEFKERISNSKETFKIEGLYKEHKAYAHSIIKQTLMYNQSRLNELMSSFDGKLFSGKDELKELIMGNYLDIERQGDHVLSKLTQDIFEEFKIGDIWDESII
ncbi:hypothetical protein EO244_14115 [Ancylomarina salipaludis]|uniref:HNH endonuclease n=1 Tax=Ancylomarina salipaludis TaxID=2501299 RepID=A0A4Q1JIN9_9BACT|nr:hypothetical protein [Ancylomarina salipaludis]RXQ89498.1 hypothetical protein EO244_14115 [Ancylomarina salipaludis]